VSVPEVPKTTQNKAEALQSAMRDLREQYPHPFYWAPFVLVGKYE
jgi:CHAT domain-containing protein